MKQIDLGKSGLMVSEIALGCMRISDIDYNVGKDAVRESIYNGINFFDHADIYGAGKCEEVFAKIMKEEGISRQSIIIQSKCGIRPGFYDFSKEYILNSVDGILKRLDTDYLDVLLLHRPDTLMEPDEVAEAFDILKTSGKVLNFGVSNHNPMQIELLQKSLNQKLIANQLQLSVTNTGMIDNGITVNMKIDNSINRDGSVLEYCRVKDITIQAWSPFQYGFFEGVFLNNDKFPDLNQKIDQLAEEYGVTNSAIAIAFILRHPAKIQAVLGTMNKSRIKDICEASKISLSREHWYEIYRSAGNFVP